MRSIDELARLASAGPTGAGSEPARSAGSARGSVSGGSLSDGSVSGGSVSDGSVSGGSLSDGSVSGGGNGTGGSGISRRGVLTVGAIGLAGAALAACSQAASPDNPTVTGSAGGAGAGGSAKPLAQLSAIPVGEAVSATGPNGASLIIARPTSGTVAAFSAICTHQACTVVPAGKQLDCPCHGSVYNATTGTVINGPAPQPLHPVPVKLSGDNVLPA